ncbi:N-6 DNA methylase [Phocaeicola vulgatus]|uniref:N-6 DNA methylase n=1 Tax=Phocaeicola vulgatus TaxID=821 RepID=A0A6I0ZT90_PHOVU|nr:N-6 DNA methylase [Phocaeicola vulgatus]KAB6459857.1 N-6 DNA methylase [Phocaeicola vulgatus]KAB6463037.1 N-6 DNA methylase [Phocaeicola vulgatus]KAB6473481.1 N-6 DNA methylase [Phocaeicola vulgatus]KAB6483207.1 N-6 DNA methylase [Phocaeicola vulgatus]
MSYSKLKSLVANVEAIATAMKVRIDDRQATDEEKEVLSRYSGFGGIKDVLNIGTEHTVSDDVAEPIRKLQDLIGAYPYYDDAMRQAVINSIKSSVLTAFYTPKFLVDAVTRQIHATFKDNCLQMSTFLEPSAGIGGFLPVSMPGTRSYAFEKDCLTGLILSLLYDEATTVTAGFETIADQHLEHESFDVIASNIPFGNFRVFDAEMWKKGGMYEQSAKTIHNYFFVKAMELLNEGGLLAFVAPRGIADTPGNKFVREYLVNHADLITALRLPDTLFMQTSGIEVGSDLLIFQKHSRKATLSLREKMFLQVSKEKVDTAGTMTDYANKIFTLPKTALATDSRIALNQFGKYVRKYQWLGDGNAMSQYLSALLKYDFDRYFRKALFANHGQDNTPVQMSLFGEPQTVKGIRAYTEDMETWMKNGAMVVFEGQVGTLRFRKSSRYTETAVDFVPVDEGKVNTDRAADYFPIRKVYFELSGREREEQKECSELRKQLNTLYDAFIAKWGFFHDNDNKEFILLDSLGTEVFTIEMQVVRDIFKADVMREPVAFKKIDTAVTLSPVEALASSLNFYGKVDMGYMAQATNKEEEEIIEALQGEIFYNPANGEWEHKGKFLSGNIIAKQEETLSFLPNLAGKEKEWAEASAKALENTIPEPIPYEELDINMGERWIDTKLYADFASDLFGVGADVMYFDVNDTYLIRLQGYSPVAYNTYSVRNYNGEDLFVHALHDTVPEITKEEYRNGSKIRVPDEEAMQEAAAKIQEIRDRFNRWLDDEPLEVRDELVRTYNERFNCYVRPHYDGSAQTFPGLSFELFPYKELYPSQKDAIWMIKQNGGGICWHEVGTGKTMIMCVAAYEMKRLGLVQKPLIIGLKANVHEIADTFRKAYPTAKVLYPGKEDFTPANRKEVFSKIKNNNWDCIILTHDQFSKIPQSEETMYDIFSEELADVERSLEVLEQSTMRYRSGRMQKGLETRKQNLEAKLAELQMKIDLRKDDTIDFRSMGIDHIFVDECHCYKNLMFQTRHTRVAGIGNAQGSQRAMNLLFAIRDIQRRTGKDLGATFLSGTVVVNALTELYVMFKYLRPRELKRQQVSCFDAWAAIFTKKAADYELNVTGTIKRKERFRTYIKVPELAMFLREITDYRTADMINLDVPDKNVRFLSHAPTIQQEEMIGRLVAFAHSGQWEDLGLDIPQPDNLDKAKMLVATNVARKMSLDMRLLGDKFTDDPNNKASICARTIYDYYVSSNANRGTQFVFSDLATYKPNEWNIYSDIKDKLVAMGIPADEIQFIQYAKTERARKKLFADMNSGRVRVLFGSTSMLGTGVNAQERAVAVHHLEIPWRPADMEQRNGRAVRKGNTVKLWGNNTVDVVIYGTEKTLDAYKFNLLKTKQMFINQINNGTIAVRRIDEDAMDEDNGMNFAEFVALLSGNTDLLEKTKLDNKIMQLEKEQAIFKKDRIRAERKIAANREDMTKAESAAARMTQDWEYITSYTGDRTTRLLNLAQATAEETGRELHRISKTYRNGAIGTIGTYAGLNLSVYSEYDMGGTFYRNTFLVEGVSGLKYRCGISGALPLGFVESSRYPQAALAKLPGMIEEQRQKIAKLESEIPALQGIIARKWSKADELARLKQECNALQHRIDESMKEAERTQSALSEHEATDKAA